MATSVLVSISLVDSTTGPAHTKPKFKKPVINKTRQYNIQIVQV